jgi:beta-xylosidase
MKLLTPSVRWFSFALALTTSVAASAASTGPWVPDRGDGTYHNPVIDADYSDPDAVRVGDDFWMTSSSFSHVPGLPILHSRDLVNWSLVTYALPRLVPEEAFATPQQGKGVWAPAIRYHRGEFWIYYPDPDFGIYVIKAKDPRGPWSTPVLVKGGKGLIDPCPLWDDDGRVYLIHAWAASRSMVKNSLTLLELNADGTKVIDDFGYVINGDKLPGYTTLEGPKLYKRDGWYYVFAPAGGVKPGWQSVFRARSIRGPYEDRITLEQGRTPINGPHQGALVDTPNGEWWFLHFQDKDAYGRVVHLQPVRWVDGWPVMGNDPQNDGRGEPYLTHAKPAVPTQPIVVPPTTDEFEGATAGLQWQWQANPGRDWSRVEQGKLVLAAQPPAVPSLWTAPHLFMQKFPAEKFTVTTSAAAGPDARAALVVFGAAYAWLGVERQGDGARIVLKRCLKAMQGGKEEEVFSAPLPRADAVVELRVSVDSGAVCRFSYRVDEGSFQAVPGTFTAEAGRWVGAKVGVFADRLGATATEAKFDWFRVVPGVQP